MKCWMFLLYATTQAREMLGAPHADADTIPLLNCYACAYGIV